MFILFRKVGNRADLRLGRVFQNGKQAVCLGVSRFFRVKVVKSCDRTTFFIPSKSRPQIFNSLFWSKKIYGQDFLRTKKPSLGFSPP